MTFTFNNYATNELSKSPINDIISGLFGGYEKGVKANYLRPTLEEQLKKAKLENQYYGPNIESQMGLRGAQAGHLGALTQGLNISNPYLKQKLEDEEQKRQFELQNPFFGQTGTSGDLGRMVYLQQMLKNNPELASQFQTTASPSQLPSPQGLSGQEQSYIPPMPQQFPGQQSSHMDMQSLIQDAFRNVAHGKQKQFAPSNILKLQNELKDIESGKFPGTNEPIPNEQIKEELAAPYREKLSGLKAGEHHIYDPETHEKIGVQRPYTAKERETETGRAFFNHVFPKINNGFGDFIGKGSVNNFIKYANDYGKNEVATRKIDDLLLAQKLVTAGVVNESATLGAGKTNMTFRNLAKSFPNSDLPKMIEMYEKGLKLPPQAFLKAGIRFNKVINQASEKAAGSVPALKTQYYHPEKFENKKQEKQSSSKNEPHYSDADIRNTAAKYGITEKEVRQRLKRTGKNG